MSQVEHIVSGDIAPGTPAYDVVVIGASAGGIPALIAILSALPADFGIPILVVQHLPAKSPSMLPSLLGWRTPLAVRWAADGELMAPSTVYVARPDHHLLIGPDRRLALSDAARVGWWRPSVDALFQSAAIHNGGRAIGIVLSGVMWDGASGMAAIAAAGGITIVQDEASSAHFDMPAAACDFGRADLLMSPRQIVDALCILSECTVANENCWEGGPPGAPSEREHAL